MKMKFLVILAAILYSMSFAEAAKDSAKVQTKASEAKVQTKASEAKVQAKASDAKVQKPVAERYLHVATNPTAVDVYINRPRADFSTEPDYVSPDFVKVPQGDSTVRITLFQVGYSDTTIKASLSEKDTSYLIVSLQQSYDDEIANSQKKLLAHRKRKSLGHKLIWASLVPFTASAISAIVTQKYIQDARDDRKDIENSRIRNSDSYQDKKDSFADNRSKAKTAKAIGGTTLGLGIVVLSAGLILSF